MAVYKTLGMPGASDAPRATLAVGETGALAIGTPVQITVYPLNSATTDEHKVKVCPDGARPDAVTLSAIDETTPGTIAYLNKDRLPLRLGGTVNAYEPLKVASGKWIKAAAMETGYAASRMAGAANDVVNGFGTSLGKVV